MDFPTQARRPLPNPPLADLSGRPCDAGTHEQLLESSLLLRAQASGFVGFHVGIVAQVWCRIAAQRSSPVRLSVFTVSLLLTLLLGCESDKGSDDDADEYSGCPAGTVERFGECESVITDTATGSDTGLHGDEVAVYLEAGAPKAGVAEQPIDFPMGAPMGGYSDRCDYLGSSGAVDNRDSVYTVAFASSSGIQTRSQAKALWLTNDDQDLVIIKVDVVYTFDGMVRDLERRLERATGRDLAGRIVLTSSHTHSAPANYSESFPFHLGGDWYNEEVYRRFTTTLEQTALVAWDRLEPASIGMGVAEDWDPDDLVYGDRRSENDDLKVWDDKEPGKEKDGTLWLLRVDAADGTPLGLFFNFGMHGTTLDTHNALVSTDSTGHVENVVQDYFDTPVVVAHWQGSGGDSSPRGSDEGYARLESVGEYAADAIVDLWEVTPTNSHAVQIETVTHSIPEDLDTVRVTRNGTVDWYYPHYDEDRVSDGLIYDEDGQILSPLDEFNAIYGGVFCGYDDALIAAGSIGATVYPYDGCTQVEMVTWVITAVFGLEEGTIALPVPSSQQAMTTAARIGPIEILQPDGSSVTDDAYFGFFPGETTAMFTEQYERRMASEVGAEHAFTVGYSQDHEGYLLIPEDWLVGGYESHINVWGPLQGEHIMEGNLNMVSTHLLTTLLEPQDAEGRFPDTAYPDRELPSTPPDTTADAGTTATDIPEDLYIPLDVEPQTQPDPTVPRVQGIAQLIWAGGDPAVDLPRVVLEQRRDGEWIEVHTNAGRVISDSLHDIITAYTPDPLYPWEAAQTHHWWAAWQAVGHRADRAGVPTGTYRLHVYGNTYVGDDHTWPWTSAEYEVTSDPFEVTTAEITVSTTTTGVNASINGPEGGYRLIHLNGSSVGTNPLVDPQLIWQMADGSEIIDDGGITSAHGVTTFTTDTPDGAAGVVVRDIYGNTATLGLP